MTRAWKAAGAFFICLVPLLGWADVLNLEENLPLRVTDAYVQELLGREFQTYLRYDLTEQERDLFVYEARLETGVWWNTQFTAGVPFNFGNWKEDREGVGNVLLDLLHNLNQETLSMPAISVGGLVEAPTNEEAEGWDPGVRAILTKTIPGTSQLHRLHLNFLYQWNDDQAAREESGRYELVGGYQVRVTNQLMALADIVRETDFEEDVEHNLVEVGLRYGVTPRTVLSWGAGTGFGDESPQLVSTIGWQVTF